MPTLYRDTVNNLLKIILNPDYSDFTDTSTVTTGNTLNNRCRVTFLLCAGAVVVVSVVNEM